MILMDLLNHISGVCCPVCACVLLQHSLLLWIRVEQRKQFGSVSAFLFLDRRSELLFSDDKK